MRSLLFFRSLLSLLQAMTTNLSLIIPVLAIAYLLLVYGALWWWSRRSTRSSRT